MTDTVPVSDNVSTSNHSVLLPGTQYNVDGGNHVAFTQDNVTTSGGYRYAVWTDNNQNPVVGRYRVLHDEWETFDLSTITGNPLSAPTEADAHNNYAIAVDASGYIHIAGNHHDDPLRYVRSSRPGSIREWTSPAMVGTLETQVTYPSFLTCSDGELLFIYRDGFSGNGEMVVNAYQTGTQTWVRRSVPISGRTASPDESPYWNHLSIDSTGIIHVWYIWRETSNVTTSHDIHFMKSDDNMATFSTVDGTALALPLEPDDVVDLMRASTTETLINQVGSAVDANDRPHACWWLLPSGSTVTQLYHMSWDGAAWQAEVLRNIPGIGPTSIARPMMFAAIGRVFVVYSEESTDRYQWWCEDVTDGVDRFSRFILFVGDSGRFEPSFDTRSFDERDELVVMWSTVGAGVSNDIWESATASIESWDLSRFGEVVRTASSDRATFDPVAVMGPALVDTFGGPTFTAAETGLPAWSLNPQAQQVLTGTAPIPPSWRTWGARAYVMNAGAGAGDITLQMRHGTHGIGSSVAGGEVNNGNVTATADTDNRLFKVELVAGVDVIPGALVRFSVRTQTSGATLANIVALERVEFYESS